MVDAFKEYILQNWILVLVLGAFAIILFTTVFLSKKATMRMFILILSVFALSISVFIEFYITPTADNALLRKILMAIRYSATPFIIALVTYALVKQLKAFIFIPAGVLLIVDIISIFTGIVFDVKDGVFVRGPVGFLPFAVSGLYMVFLIYILIKRSNKRMMDIIPIVFMSLALLSGLIFPFVFGPDYAKIFCSIIAVALFVYYVFQILQLSKNDPLTGLLNRQAYYAEIDHNRKDITAIISLDMNGLKEINDTYGHAAGDEALITLALCFFKACRKKESVYRVGGDEFIIVCRKTDEEELNRLINQIKKNVSETKYTCSIGYCVVNGDKKHLDEYLKESDKMMYENKANFYSQASQDRRNK